MSTETDEFVQLLKEGGHIQKKTFSLQIFLNVKKKGKREPEPDNHSMLLKNERGGKGERPFFSY